MLAELTVNAPAGERRVALEKRRRVAEMSKEGMQRLLLTSEVAGLPNRRAFNEAGLAYAVAMCDVDGLKALNGLVGMSAGDAVLKARATPCEKQVLMRITIRAMSSYVVAATSRTWSPNSNAPEPCCASERYWSHRPMAALSALRV